MGQASLEDVVSIIGHQLTALGHQCVYDKDHNKFLGPDAGINMVVEGFTPGPGGSINAIQDGWERGARFVIIATEEPTADGFNHGIDPEMKKRQGWFPLAAKFAEGIFYLVPGKHVHDWYSQWAPSAPVELGYAPTLMRKLGPTERGFQGPGIAPTLPFASPKSSSRFDLRYGSANPTLLLSTLHEPEYEYGFFGSLTERRLKILKRLARDTGIEKAVRIESTFPEPEVRDRVVKEAKIVVQIRKDERMGLVSSSRCNTTLCNWRPIIAEPHDLDSPWRDVVAFADSMEDFYAKCSMARSQWRSLHAKQLDAFKRIMSPEICIGRALREINLDMNFHPLLKERRVAS
jgi:hypothetical protein